MEVDGSVKARRISPDRLRKSCDPKRISYEDTTLVPALKSSIGQQRAEKALAFGLEIKTAGFNVFAAGPVGTGRETMVRKHVERAAAAPSQVFDWCYVYNFKDERKPRALKLPAGRGRGLVKDADELIADARRELPKIFETEEYERRRNAHVADLQKQRDDLLKQTQEKAKEMGFVLRMTLQGFATLPIVDSQAIEPEQFDALPEDTKRDIQSRGTALQEEIRSVMSKMRAAEKDTHDKMGELDRQMSLMAVGQLLETLKERYDDCPDVLQYLQEVAADVIDHLDDFKKAEEAVPALPFLAAPTPEQTFARYKVNLFVDNAETAGAPAVFENSPNYYNVFGRIEYESVFGGTYTDFSQIKPGAIHRANGGYLVLQALDVLSGPFVWETLKRTLRSGQARLENLGEQYRMIPLVTLEPEPLPVDVKVVLIGNPQLFELLQAYDEDFRRLFKVKADFEVDMKRDAKAIRDYCAQIADTVKREKLCPFDRTGLAKMVEYGSWLAEDQDRLSTRFMDVSDLASEASYWSTTHDHCRVTASDVERAQREKRARDHMIEDRVQRLFEEDVLLVDTTGEVAGQVNGLAIYAMGDVAFGRPNRITARTRVGREGVIDIEREAKLSGPTHSKGVLILSSFLSSTFGQQRPLAVAATLTFEQSYGEVEGDSASMAELCALLSSLSGVPIRQGVAMTGSVDQFGKAQAIGGVNRKIEGFYDVCAAKGLDGEQGVIIPKANLQNLMLREDVVGAVADGKFNVWSMNDVAEAVETLTGVALGKARAAGGFSPGSILARADEKLEQFAKLLKEHGVDSGRSGDTEGAARHAGS
jgi:predicted ATP-dependent protease